MMNDRAPEKNGWTIGNYLAAVALGFTALGFIGVYFDPPGWRWHQSENNLPEVDIERICDSTGPGVPGSAQAADVWVETPCNEAWKHQRFYVFSGDGDRRVSYQSVATRQPGVEGRHGMGSDAQPRLKADGTRVLASRGHDCAGSGLPVYSGSLTPKVMWVCKRAWFPSLTQQ